MKGMSMECPVVKVKFDNEQGYYLLNESDFDETKHELFTEPAETETGLSQTVIDVKTDERVTVAKTQGAGVVAPKLPWGSKKDKP
jgi:hypothetical protein